MAVRGVADDEGVSFAIDRLKRKLASMLRYAPFDYAVDSTDIGGSECTGQYCTQYTENTCKPQHVSLWGSEGIDSTLTSCRAI